MGFKNNVSGTISNLSQQLKLQSDNADSIKTGATNTTKLEENMEIVDFKKVNNAPENAYTDTASNKSIYSDTMLQYMNAESQYKNLDNKKKELQSELNTLNAQVNQDHVSVDQFVGDDDDYSDDVFGFIDKALDYTGYLAAAAYTNTVSGLESVFTGILFNSDGSLMSYEDYLKSQVDGELTFNGTEGQINQIEQNHKDYYAKLDAYVRKNTGMSYEEFEAKRKSLQQDIETIDSYKYPLRQMVKEKPYIEISETDEFQNYKSSLGNINAKIDELETSQKFNESKRYLNDDDKTMYLYLLENKGKEAADDYLKAIQDKINKSKGYYDAWELIDSITETEIFDENGNLKLEEIYEMDANGNIITDANGMPKIKLKIMENIPDRALDDVKTAFAGLEDGVNTFLNGINNILTTEGMMSDEQYKQTYLMTFLAQAQNSGIDTGNLGHIYNISNSIGNMAIPIVVGMMINAYAPGAAPTLVEASGISASSFASTGLIGLSVFGNSKNDALVEGHDLESATVYALCSALSETSLQLFLGNIPVLNDGAKFTAKEILSEGFEEFLQTWVDAGMRAVIFKEKPNFESLTEESFQAFIYGCVTSGVLTGGQSAISFTLAGVDYTFNNLEELIAFSEKNNLKFDRGKLIKPGLPDGEAGKQAPANGYTDTATSDGSGANKHPTKGYMNVPNQDTSSTTPSTLSSDTTTPSTLAAGDVIKPGANHDTSVPTTAYTDAATSDGSGANKHPTKGYINVPKLDTSSATPSALAAGDVTKPGANPNTAIPTMAYTDTATSDGSGAQKRYINMPNQDTTGAPQATLSSDTDTTNPLRETLNYIIESIENETLTKAEFKDMLSDLVGPELSSWMVTDESAYNVFCELFEACSNTGMEYSKLERCLNILQAMDQYYLDAANLQLESGTGIFETYRTHGIVHIFDVLSESVNAYNAMYEAGRTDLDLDTIMLAAVMHDTGMSGGQQLVLTVENDQLVINTRPVQSNGASYRESHSFNSAVNIINEASALENAGYSRAQIAEAALLAFAHSKSNSGLNPLYNNPEGWSFAIQALQEATKDADFKIVDELINAGIIENNGATTLTETNVTAKCPKTFEEENGHLKKNDAGKPIKDGNGGEKTGKINTYQFNQEVLARLSYEALAVRIGDALTNNDNALVNQYLGEISFNSPNWDNQSNTTEVLERMREKFKEAIDDKECSVEETPTEKSIVRALLSMKDGLQDAAFAETKHATAEDSVTFEVDGELRNDSQPFVLGENNQTYEVRANPDGGIEVIIKVKESEHVPFCTLFAIQERAGELLSIAKEGDGYNTKAGALDIKLTIEIDAETSADIKDLYKQYEDYYIGDDRIKVEVTDKNGNPLFKNNNSNSELSANEKSAGEMIQKIKTLQSSETNFATVLNQATDEELLNCITTLEKTNDIDLLNSIFNVDMINEPYMIRITEILLQPALVYYEKASKLVGGEGYANFLTYRTHCEGHVKEVAAKTLESLKNIQESLKKNPSSGYSSEINMYESYIAALWHDTGMAASIDGNVALDSQIENNKIVTKFLTENKGGNVTRNNHSFNSAMTVLINSDIISQLGVDPNIIALLCYSHSKSNSGVRALNIANDWSICISKMESAVDFYNSNNPNNPIKFSNTNGTDFIESLVASGVLKNADYEYKTEEIKGKNIEFKKFNLNPEMLARLASEAYSLRLGDANTNNRKLGINQAGDKIDLDSTVRKGKTSFDIPENGFKSILDLVAIESGVVEEEYTDASGKKKSRLIDGTKVMIGDELVTLDKFGAAFIYGENNLDFSTDTDSEGRLVERFTVIDPTEWPAATLFNIDERLGEVSTAKGFETKIEIVLNSEDVQEQQKNQIETYYQTFADERGLKCKITWQ